MASLFPREAKVITIGRFRFAAVVLAIASLAAQPVIAADATARVPVRSSPGATASISARTCDVLPQARRLGPTYVTSLTVLRTSCAAGVRLVRAYYHCRVRAGGVRGTCKSLVLGYRCHESRHGIAVQFNAKVTCTRGSLKIRHSYTQDT